MSADNTRAELIADRLESDCPEADDCFDAAAELRRLSASESALIEALSAQVDAWESLSGGRRSLGDVQHWLTHHMKPAVDYARAALKAAKEARQ